MKKVLFMFAGICFLGCSCTTTKYYRTTIDSIVSKDIQIENKTYTLVPLNSSKEDLYFKEYSLYIKHALQKKGYIYTDSKTAPITIFVDYGVGEPKTFEQNTVIPTYGTTATVINGQIGHTPIYGNTFSYGQTGNVQIKEISSVYPKYIVIYACDTGLSEKAKQIVPIWQTEIFNIDTYGDLRLEFPIMIKSALPYIAEDTYRIILNKDEESSESTKQFIKNSNRKLLEMIEYNKFINSDRIKQYQEKRDKFSYYNKLLQSKLKNEEKIQEHSKSYRTNPNKALVEGGLKNIRNNINDKLSNLTQYEIEYYINEFNKEYFDDVDYMINKLKNFKKSSPNNVLKTAKKDSDINDLIQVKILQDNIIDFIDREEPFKIKK